MARSSSALPVALLALVALFVAPAFVPSPAPRAAPEASAAAITAGAVLPLLTAQPAMAEDCLRAAAKICSSCRLGCKAL